MKKLLASIGLLAALSPPALAMTEVTTGWNKIIDGGYTDVQNAAAVDSTGAVYAVGYGINLAGDSTGRDWWIRKYDNAGNLVCSFVYDAASHDDEATGVAVSGDDKDVYVIGYATNLFANGGGMPVVVSGKDWVVKKFTPGCVEETAGAWPVTWTSFYAWYDFGDDVPHGIAIANGDPGPSDDAILVTGERNDFVAANSAADMALVRYSNAGVPLWEAGASSACTADRPDVGWSVAVDEGINMVYVAGEGPGLVKCVVSSWQDWRVSAHRLSDGDPQWEVYFDGTAQDDAAYSVAVDSYAHELYVVGTGIDVAGSGTGRDALLKKYDQFGSEVTSGWNKVFDYGSADVFRGVVVHGGYDVLAVGSATNAVGINTDLDWFLADFDSAGSSISSALFDGPASGDNEAVCVAEDPTSGDVFVGGYVKTDWGLKRITP